MAATPHLELYSHVDKVTKPHLQQILQWSHEALPKVIVNGSTNGPVDLPNLTTIEISIVDDPIITQVHADFLNDPTPTDVITFPHGEILVSYDTAELIVEEDQNTHSVWEELLLYIIHGLLHLNGHLDHDPKHQQEMHAKQDQIWKDILG